MQYAKFTKVEVEQSRVDIKILLARYGATDFKEGWADNKEAMQFFMQKKLIRFILPMPKKDDVEFVFSKTGHYKHPEGKKMLLWEQARRTAYRALVLSIRAKLAAVEAGISTFEEEFFTKTVLPTNRTLFQELSPIMDKAINNGKMPQIEQQ